MTTGVSCLTLSRTHAAMLLFVILFLIDLTSQRIENTKTCHQSQRDNPAGKHIHLCRKLRGKFDGLRNDDEFRTYVSEYHQNDILHLEHAAIGILPVLCQLVKLSPRCLYLPDLVRADPLVYLSAVRIHSNFPLGHQHSGPATSGQPREPTTLPR